MIQKLDIELKIYLLSGKQFLVYPLRFIFKLSCVSLAKAGITEDHLKDKKTAKFITKFMQENANKAGMPDAPPGIAKSKIFLSKVAKFLTN